MHRMRRVDASAQQVPRQPAPLVLEVGLILERRRAVDRTQVVGLQEARGRIDGTNRPHRQDRGAAFVDQYAGEGASTALVGKPMAVQSAETRGGERLVDGRIPLEPGESPRELTGIFGE